ncbi:hypothetical protein E2C01_009199 [Portunus trituberculatus]|uniref:Uncharacterized protein n=1 Tax=Portunus trituberculatus TaxID=210409 RepID=A0A5B7D4S4_PORTR|nr:hypothetical protein [Portunus trituberculatus]
MYSAQTGGHTSIVGVDVGVICEAWFCGLCESKEVILDIVSCMVAVKDAEELLTLLYPRKKIFGQP